MGIMKRGIALFSSFAPDVCSELCKMNPLAAAECIEHIADDLNYIPTDRIGYSCLERGAQSR
jgi:hypothetical protein